MFMNQFPSIGRIVHYVTVDGRHYPAIIITVFSQTTVNLHVFVGKYDVLADHQPTSVVYN